MTQIFNEIFTTFWAIFPTFYFKIYWTHFFNIYRRLTLKPDGYPCLTENCIWSDAPKTNICNFSFIWGWICIYIEGKIENVKWGSPSLAPRQRKSQLIGNFFLFLYEITNFFKKLGCYSHKKVGKKSSTRNSNLIGNSYEKIVKLWNVNWDDSWFQLKEFFLWTKIT
jgi:hypothetical protein